MDPTNQTSEVAQPEVAAQVAPPSDAAAPAEQPQAADAKQPTLWEQLTAKPDETTSPGVEEPNPATEPAPVEEPKPKVARKLADIAEREAAAARMAAEAQAHAQELADARATLAGLKTDPLATLEKAGLTYEQLTLEALKGKRTTAPSPELEAVRAELQKQIEVMKADYTNGKIAEIKGSLRAHIESSGDKYELIQARGAIDQVWQTMVAISQESGGKVIPTFDQAAELVEKTLDEEANVYAKTKKFQAKVQPPAPEKVATAAPGTSAPAAKVVPKPALTNTMGAPVVTSAPQKPKTKEEAFKAFRGLVDKAFRGEGLR